MIEPGRSDSIDDLRQAWARRAAMKARAERELRRRALEKSRAAARHLKEKYGVRRVYLYGSLVWGSHFTPHSDIDLLVEGLPAEVDYWRLVVEVERITAPLPVSVVPVEDALPGLTKKVLEEGVPL
ncbi:MAG: nucleotidyltransferase family protein [Desulfotomaculales bacterium]